MSVWRKLWILLFALWFLLIISALFSRSSRQSSDSVKLQVQPEAVRMRPEVVRIKPEETENKILLDDLLARTDSKYALYRQARHITREVWRLAKSQLSSSNVSPSQKLSQEELLDWFDRMSLLLETKLTGASRVNGQAEELIAQLDALAQSVQEKIFQLQNPPDCRTARYIVTRNDKPCGFGCRAHHLLYCLHIALTLNRTLYIDEDVKHTNFLPATSCIPPQTKGESFSSGNRDSQILHCPIIDMVSSNLVPQAVPRDLAKVLAPLHGAPFPWYAGQLLRYLFRLKEGEFKKSLEANLKSLRTEASVAGYRQPIVGIHVRRTDKVGTEAAFHAVSEYMVHAERFFQQKELERQIANADNYWTGDVHAPVLKSKPLKRRVYVATDDPSVFQDARKQYPEYEFIGSSDRAASAKVGMRSSQTGLQGIITDIIMLANTDFLSCTFSSQVCRLAYELLQTQHHYLGDASGAFESLDDLYYFGGQQELPWKTIMPDPKRGIRLNDQYKIHGNHWDGFAKAERRGDTHEIQMLPAYLFYQQVVLLPDMP